MITPILMLGAGRMGGAILEGWARAGAFAAGEIIFRHGMALMTGEQPSLAQAAAMIDVAVEGADRFFPAFDFLVQGSKSPAEAIAACMFETVGEA